MNKALWLLAAAVPFTCFASPQIVAHRGASSLAPENTLPAFSKAMEDRADFLELDIHQSADGQIMVMHDSTVDRTTNGSGKIRDLTQAKIKQLEAGEKFSSVFKGTKVPTLAEVFDLVQNRNIQVIVELKDGNSIYPGIEEKVVAMIRDRKIEKQVVLKSFNTALLKRLKTLAPDIRQIQVYIYANPFFIVTTKPQFKNILHWNGDFLQPHARLLSKSFVRHAHAQGYKVIAWGVNHDSTYEHMVRIGVDLIETNNPAAFKSR